MRGYLVVGGPTFGMEQTPRTGPQNSVKSWRSHSRSRWDGWDGQHHCQRVLETREQGSRHRPARERSRRITDGAGERAKSSPWPRLQRRTWSCILGCPFIQGARCSGVGREPRRPRLSASSHAWNENEKKASHHQSESSQQRPSHIQSAGQC